MTLHIHALKAFDSNYIWTLRRTDSDKLTVIDPGDGDVVIDYCQANQLAVTDILITHGHYDHIDGVKTLCDVFDAHVYSPLTSNSSPSRGEGSSLLPKQQFIPNVNTQKTNQFQLENIGLTFDVISTPGHTHDHVVYYAAPYLFCGDALFAGGCGRVFTGDMATMWRSLQKLAALPDDTQVYCTHEYTLSNLQFAHRIAPDWQPITDRLASVKTLRAQEQITLPSTIGLEKQTNIFLLCNNAQFRAEIFNDDTLRNNSLTAFTHLREAKDAG